MISSSRLGRVAAKPDCPKIHMLFRYGCIRSTTTTGTLGYTRSWTCGYHYREAQLRGRRDFHSTLISPTGFGFQPVAVHYHPTLRHLSSTSMVMTATKIDGMAIAKGIREGIYMQIQKTQTMNPAFKPCFMIIQVGDRTDSTSYVRMKLKAAREASIECELLQYPESVTEAELIQQITRLNEDAAVHGILVQLPVPKHISEYAVTSAVSNQKDVDGFGTTNIGKLAKRGGNPPFTPCTPKGVMVLLKEAGVDLVGKHAVVLGRSDIVGSPVSYLLKNSDATVTICHSKTRDLQAHIKQADVLVAAIGQPSFVKGDWLKPGVVVIDVGTNYVPDETKKSGQRLEGDVDFESASKVASQLTPVPGGVGPMTVAMLLQNVVNSATMYFESQEARPGKVL